DSGRSAAGDARPASASRRHSDAGPISAAVDEASADHSLRSPGRVRRIQAGGTRNGLRARGSGTASEKLLSRGRCRRSGVGGMPAVAKAMNLKEVAHEHLRLSWTDGETELLYLSTTKALYSKAPHIKIVDVESIRRPNRRSIC